MTPELWKKVKATLAVARSLPADRREAELDRLRQEDPELATEVVSLLQQQAPPPEPDQQPAMPVVQEEVGAEKTRVRPEGNLDHLMARVWAAVPLGDPSADPDSIPPDVPGCQLDGGEENVRYGGMGVVYFGTEWELRRPVAVKVLRRRLAGEPILVARFRDESLIAAQLQHPGIVPVYAIGQLADGRPYCTMKLVRGETFSDVLKRRPTPLADLIPNLAIFRRVCDALGYAHGKRIIHRDLKPSNVMVGAHGEVLLVDWGLAKKLGDRAPAEPTPEPHSLAVVVDTRTSGLETQSGLGSLPYLAPEQAAGRMDEVDERSDVFGLGAMLCVILTGQPPYIGPNEGAIERKALRADLEEAYERLDQCGADPELSGLAKRCLAKDRAARPADGSVVANLVAAYVFGVEERRRQAEVDRARAEGETEEQQKRRRVQLALVGALSMLIFGSGAVAWWEWKRTSDHEAVVLRQQIEEERHLGEERDRAKRAVAEIERLMNECEAALSAGDADLARGLLTAAEQRTKDAAVALWAEMLSRLERSQRDLRILAALDAIDNYRLTVVDPKFPSDEAVAQRWSEAFSNYGLLHNTTPLSEAVQRVRESLVRDRLLQVLDLWLVAGGGQWVQEVLRSYDADEYRQLVRGAIASGNQLATVLLVAQPKAMSQPGRFAAAIGRMQAVSQERRRAVLEAAAVNSPGDFNILMSLASLYSINDRNIPVDQIVLVNQARWAQSAVGIRPRNCAAHNNLGNALSHVRDLDNAIRTYQRAIQLDPTSPGPHINLGTALSEKGKFADAIQEYRQANDLKPNNDLVYCNMGNTFYAMGSRGEAKLAYQRAIELDPKYAHPHHGLGLILSDEGNRDGAIREYSQAIKLDPKLPIPHNNLGYALYETGDVDGAMRQFQLAIGVDKQYAQPHNGLGNCLRDKGDLSGAIQEYRRAIECNRTYPYPHSNLGQALYTQGHLEEAILEFRRANQLNSNDARSHDGLGNALRQKGDEDGAIAAYHEAVRLRSRRARTYINLAELLNKRQESQAALEVLLKGLRVERQYATEFRYVRACCACNLASARAKDTPDTVDGTGLRRQSLGWLQEELVLQQNLAREAAKRSGVCKMMQDWTTEPSLAGVRDVARLPLDERAGWAKFWADVRRLRDDTAPGVAPPPRLVKRSSGNFP